MKKKVGLLGGSFDPIHFGHLNFAINVRERCSLDRVLFCPNVLSPFKTENPPFESIEHRLEMVRLAINSVPGLEVLDWETVGEGPHYTIDTVRKLARDSSIELHLLIAEDHLATLDKWKEWEELLRLAPPIVAARSEARAPIPRFSAQLERVEIPLFDVSSTEIRVRLSQKKYCGHLLPALVLDYISQHRLYS